MAQARIKGIPAIKRQVESTFKKVKSSKPMLNEIGTFTVSTVALSARRRKPLNSTKSFPALKDSTKSRRKSDAKYNKTHPAFNATRSNLTFSGQLIDALKFIVSGAGSIIVSVADTIRSPRVDKSGKPIDAGETNAAVDADLRIRGFFLFTQKGLDQDERYRLRLNNIVKKYVRRAIKVNFGP